LEAIGKTQGIPEIYAYCTLSLGYVYLYQESFLDAGALFDQALSLHQQGESWPGIMYVKHAKSRLSLKKGDVVDAAHALKEVLAEYRSKRYLFKSAEVMIDLARCLNWIQIRQLKQLLMYKRPR
jgi:hypothetical protein